MFSLPLPGLSRALRCKTVRGFYLPSLAAALYEVLNGYLLMLLIAAVTAHHVLAKLLAA
jgi:hypothetical protein